MKHIFKKIALAVAALPLCAFLFAACSPIAGTGAARSKLLESDESRVVIEVTAGDSAKSLYDELSVYAQSGGLSMEGSEGEYGYFITSVNGVAGDAEHFWMVYTTLGELNGVTYSDAQYGTWEYGGRTLSMASYGVSGLPLVAGELYALVYMPMADVDA